jgi:hypothetical protein
MVEKVLKIALFFFACGAFWGNSYATIMVSGDITIVEPMDPAFPPYYEDIDGNIRLLPGEGNKQFFLNILQGSNTVAVVRQEVDLSLWNPQDADQARQDAFCLLDEEYAVQTIDAFYSTIAGVTSSIVSDVTAPALNDVGLLVVPLPGNAFSAEELAVLNSYITGGGSIFFLGDGYNHPEQNANINQALLGIGSTLYISEDFIFDICIDAPIYATGTQILPNNFTQGVQSLYYGVVSEVKGGDGRVAPLFLTQEGGGVPFIAYEKSLSVPEPFMMALFFISLPALAFSIRKKKE